MKTDTLKTEIFDQYADKVCRKYKIDKKDLFIRSHRARLVNARQILYYLCYTYPMKIVHIERLMEKNGYERAQRSVINGVQQMKIRVAEDEDYVKIIENIKKL